MVAELGPRPQGCWMGDVAAAVWSGLTANARGVLGSAQCPPPPRQGDPLICRAHLSPDRPCPVCLTGHPTPRGHAHWWQVLPWTVGIMAHRLGGGPPRETSQPRPPLGGSPVAWGPVRELPSSLLRLPLWARRIPRVRGDSGPTAGCPALGEAGARCRWG